MRRRPWFSRVLLALLLHGAAAPLQGAQDAPSSDAQEAPPGALRVFIDCVDTTCDYDFIRTEIAFVTHVRDRHDAQVHVLITGQQTGESGTEFDLRFLGQQNFQGVEDSLRFTSRPGDTPDQVRRGVVDTIKRGLVRYANHTPLADRIAVLYKGAPAAGPEVAEQRDPWNYWTFATTLSSFVDGEEAISSLSLGLALSANRTTSEWKINTSVQTRYNRTSFELEEARSLASIQRNFAGNVLIVNSVTAHWSAGVRATAVSSSFLNQSSTLRLAPAVEYNIFPYVESTRRLLTVQYSVGANAFDYEEETIFGKTAERLIDQRLLLTFRTTQPWGSVTSAVEGSHYLNDLRKHRAVVFNSLDLSLARGLSLVGFSNIQVIRDQIFLPARGAAESEILLRQRQLATSFSYSFSVGLSYTFGSPRATIVNPRFSGTVGGTMITQ